MKALKLKSLGTKQRSFNSSGIDFGRPEMNMKRKLALITGAAILACSAVNSPVFAQHRPEPHVSYGHFYGQRFHDFSPYDLQIWRSGRWTHGWHTGVFGWWWFVDGGWYLYPEPIYPYPTYVPGADAYGPPPPPPPPPQSQVWYHCSNPDGYYPYVKACSGPWSPVPAVPPQAQGPAPYDTSPAPPPPHPEGAPK